MCHTSVEPTVCFDLLGSYTSWGNSNFRSEVKKKGRSITEHTRGWGYGDNWRPLFTTPHIPHNVLSWGTLNHRCIVCLWGAGKRSFPACLNPVCFSNDMAEKRFLRALPNNAFFDLPCCIMQMENKRCLTTIRHTKTKIHKQMYDRRLVEDWTDGWNDSRTSWTLCSCLPSTWAHDSGT